MKQINVLLVEDSIYSADLNVRELKRAGFLVAHQVVASRGAMERALMDKSWHLILSDNSMPGFNALEALELRNQHGKEIPFVIVSEDIAEMDVEMAKGKGCNAYISKEYLHLLGQHIKQIIGTAKDLD